MLSDEPDLLCHNVNRWLEKDPEAKCFRTFKEGFSGVENQGVARAFLGKSYRPLDNFDLLENILPKLNNAGCELNS